MANTRYENFIIANKMAEVLNTNKDLKNYMTLDNTLTESAGMKKKVNTYSVTGDVADVTEGKGNTTGLTMSYTAKEYTVVTTQGKFSYYDEQEMTDPMVVEVGLQGVSQKMTNDLTSKAIAAMDKATLIKYSFGWTFDDVVDAIAMYPYENENGLFMLINPAQKATLRKNLADELKYSEGFARTGYIGTVCGVPVIVSKAVPAGTAYLGTKEAVTCFVKKGSEIEQERDANTRKNDVYARKVMVIALTDATKMIKLTSGAKPTTPAQGG